MFKQNTAATLVVAFWAFSSAGSVSALGKYPDQPIKFIVALPAGGSVDMIPHVTA